MSDVMLKFRIERTTKNTVRYAEDGDDPKVGTLYVRKTALGEEPPNELLVTITPVGA